MKIFNLNDYKTQVDKRSYYSVLSFHQLINEAQLALSKMKDEDLDQDVLFESKLLLQEFVQRLDQISIEYSQSLELFKGQIEKGLNALDSKLS